MILHHEAEAVREFLDKWHLEESVFAPLGLLLLVIYAAIYDPATITATLAMLVAISPIWLPLFLGMSLYITWIHYVRYKFWFSRERGLLEIQLPAEVTKSPAAMEVFLASIWTTGGETTFLDRILRGGYKSTWSLEIASNEGRISFYIHGLKAWQPAIEARLYGQFPEVRVTAVDDYVSKIPFNLDEYEIWGGEYMKKNPQAAPIRTYVDFELDKNTDTPETKVDPLTNILELMNNVGKDQYLWYQLILKAHNTFEWYGFPEKDSRYVTEGKAAIAKIMQAAAVRSKGIQAAVKEEGTNGGSPTMSLTEGERDIVKGIEHSLTKNPFEVGIRVIYFAKKDKFHGIWGAYLFRMFQVFKSAGNSVGGWPGRGMIRFDVPWEDFMGIRERTIKNLLFFHYKYRAYFGVPYDQVPSIMSTEEVATLWHFPYSNVQTPGLNRVPSRTSQAPTNLPTLPE
ncbi:hypothetical protein A2419_02020 [Candidatus Adlerbacteria bacterium RIFOXYC1_FULL_48_26]|uniref:Uncharacterized protein n=1 Tax=Candidatus Adlerbacteria bacterium RIFOXYC1_FULL_48_26 TaxID=1797247 RepID=A0A1F4Y3E8_9BACT|nr:MAG: hypothetical protein A2419_02020 [Candidatus Adlerbacteria bacterium RIFOXYC1_FULL_48_26]OGC93814.1 MAG: hypothetical protein A2389_00150 [Candidatus Adlerbacteria bacterium RIFOXYB1_FULL_48_10]